MTKELHKVRSNLSLCSPVGMLTHVVREAAGNRRTKRYRLDRLFSLISFSRLRKDSHKVLMLWICPFDPGGRWSPGSSSRSRLDPPGSSFMLETGSSDGCLQPAQPYHGQLEIRSLERLPHLFACNSKLCGPDLAASYQHVHVPLAVAFPIPLQCGPLFRDASGRYSCALIVEWQLDVRGLAA